MLDRGDAKRQKQGRRILRISGFAGVPVRTGTGNHTVRRIRQTADKRKGKTKRTMKVVILAGGFGTRISEESHLKPKPMIEIGGKPVLWHIMKEYSHYGFHEFVICCGYRQHVIKEWFADYYLYNSDVTFDFADDNRMTVHNNVAEPWKVTLVDTGLHTMTGGRIRRVHRYIGDETFMLTYGDGVSSVDIRQLLAFHRSHGRMATVTAVNAGQRFGILDVGEDGFITSFREKNSRDAGLVNAGYMVFEPGIFRLLASDATVLEKEPLEEAARTGELKAFCHDGFWKCMDTQRDRQQLETMWREGQAEWKVWED